MGELLTILIVLAIFLALVTVFGHGLWLAAAWLLRALSGQHDPAAAPSRLCPTCGSALKSGNPGCAACGWPARVSPPERQARLLRSVERELDRYARSELIDAACFSRLSLMLQEEQARLKPPAPEVVAAELVTAEAISDEPIAERPAYALAVSQPAPLDPAARAQQYMARQAELARLPAEPTAAPLSKNPRVPGRRSSRPSWKRRTSAGASWSAAC